MTADTPLEIRKNYWALWKELLELEWEQEERAMRERLEQWPRSRLVKEGLCLHNVRGSLRGSFFGQVLVRLELNDRGDRLERRARHAFQAGDEVLLSRKDPLQPGTEHRYVIAM